MEQKKYISPSRLKTFFDKLIEIFAPLAHKHKIDDITDYTVDSELSSTSDNPVSNKVLNEEFDAISDAMGALELSIDSKANVSHDHDDAYYTEAEIDDRLNNAINEVKTDASNKDAVVLYEAQKGISNALDSAKEYTDVVASGKADSDHNHNDIYCTQTEIEAVLSNKSQVQIITWEEND